MKRLLNCWALFLMCGVAWLCLAESLFADGRTKIIQELVENTMQRFGRQVVREGATGLAQRIETFAAKHGDEILTAVRKCGPEAITLAENAGVKGARAAQFMARYGEEAATVLRRPKAMAQLLRFGDEASASVLVKHPGVAESLLEKSGSSAVKALEAVTPRNGRRLAMLMEGDLAECAGKEALLDVIGKYGDRAAEFLWSNKGALMVGATLTVFVTNPEPFLNGLVQLSSVAGESVAKPLAQGVAQGTNWTVVILFLLACAGGIVAWKVMPIRKHLEANPPAAVAK